MIFGIFVVNQAFGGRPGAEAPSVCPPVRELRPPVRDRVRSTGAKPSCAALGAAAAHCRFGPKRAEGLVLGCIEIRFCKLTFVLQHF